MLIPEFLQAALISRLAALGEFGQNDYVRLAPEPPKNPAIYQAPASVQE
jgi:hypothetical protein